MRTGVIKAARVLLWLIYAWVTVMLVLLFLTFILELAGANPASGFVDWVYRSVERAMAPFRGIFEPITFSDDSVLDGSVLFAMIVYGFVAIGLSAALEWMTNQLHLATRHDAERAALSEQAALVSNAPSGAAIVVQLVGPPGVTASAVLTPYVWGTSVDLTAAGLNPTRTYTVWLSAVTGTRTLIGSFQPTTPAALKLSMSSAASLAGNDTFGVTILAGLGDPADLDIMVGRIR
jgi:uncharacterized protein YggT (Ycf19 family)